MSLPKIQTALYRLAVYKTQKSISNSALAIDLTSFGWQWSEAYVSALFAGKKKITSEQALFINRYLLDRYSKESLV